MDSNPPEPSAPAAERPGAPRLQPAQRWQSVERVCGPLTRQERQDRDRSRLLAMQLEGYDGRTWKTLVEPDVWSYAVRILPRKIETGEIFAMRVGLGGVAAEDLTLPKGGICRADAEDLAADVAAGAIGVFHNQLKAGVWDITKDMTFRSWFVNLCALRFAAPYRRWLRSRSHTSALDVDAELLGSDQPTSVIYVVEFERHLFLEPDTVTRAMIRLDIDGYSDQAIAEATRTTLKTVERRLARFRERSRRRRDLEQERDLRGEYGSDVA